MLNSLFESKIFPHAHFTEAEEWGVQGFVIRVPGPRLGMRFLATARERLGEVASGEPIIVDCCEVETIDSGGVGALLGLLRLSEPLHPVLIASASEEVRSALAQAGVADLFPVFAVLDVAFSHAMQLIRLHHAIGEAMTTNVEEDEVTCQPLSSTRTFRPDLCP